MPFQTLSRLMVDLCNIFKDQVLYTINMNRYCQFMLFIYNFSLLLFILQNPKICPKQTKQDTKQKNDITIKIAFVDVSKILYLTTAIKTWTTSDLLNLLQYFDHWKWGRLKDSLFWGRQRQKGKTGLLFNIYPLPHPILHQLVWLLILSNLPFYLLLLIMSFYSTVQWRIGCQ